MPVLETSTEPNLWGSPTPFVKKSQQELGPRGEGQLAQGAGATLGYGCVRGGLGLASNAASPWGAREGFLLKTWISRENFSRKQRPQHEVLPFFLPFFKATENDKNLHVFPLSLLRGGAQQRGS